MSRFSDIAGMRNAHLEARKTGEHEGLYSHQWRFLRMYYDKLTKVVEEYCRSVGISWSFNIANAYSENYPARNDYIAQWWIKDGERLQLRIRLEVGYDGEISHFSIWGKTPDPINHNNIDKPTREFEDRTQDATEESLISMLKKIAPMYVYRL